jgi:hypothetical protein
MAVSRNVAVAEETCATVIKELDESIVASPAITLQIVEDIGVVPCVAPPVSEKIVLEPSEHRV